MDIISNGSGMKVHAQKVKKKPSGKSVFRRVNDWLHLWLGLVSGIIVFIVSITGCIYAFEKEIRDYTQPYQYIESRQVPMKSPSELRKVTEDFVEEKHGQKPNIFGVQYPGNDKAAIAAYSDKEYGYTMVYLNPYSGEVLKEKILNQDFFRIVLAGHFYLWLPPAIGQPVIAWSVLIFVLLLITGLVMWWPKNLKKTNRDKSFKIKWKASFKRVNYDLHNVLGFYSLVLALVLALTGLVWGFQWFNKAFYWTLTGGKEFKAFEKPSSDSTLVDLPKNPAGEDLIWKRMMEEYNDPNGQLMVEFASQENASIGVMYNPDYGKYFRRSFRYFDQKTLEEIPGGGGVYGEEYEQASLGDKVYRMNYDIHVGAIAGLPGKILAFFISLICASLPITGFLVWWGRKKKTKSKKVKSKAKPEPLNTNRQESISLKSLNKIPV